LAQNHKVFSIESGLIMRASRRLAPAHIGT
jgi:hypothetical protein